MSRRGSIFNPADRFMDRLRALPWISREGLIHLLNFFVAVSFIFPGGCSPVWGPKVHPDSSAGPDRNRIQANAYFQQGVQYMDQEAIEEAIASFQNAISLDPKMSSAYNNLGVLYKRKGMMGRAKEFYLKAVSSSNPLPEVHNNLGILLREQGQFHEAEREYRNAVQIDPEFSPAYYNLGILYDLYLDQPEEAIKAFSIYLEKEGRRLPEIENWILKLERRLERYSQTGFGK